MPATAHSTFRLVILFGLLLIAFAGGCSSSTEPSSSQAEQESEPSLAPTGEPVAAGDLRDERVRAVFVIFCLPDPKLDPSAELDQLLAAEGMHFARVDKFPETATDPLAAAELIENPAENYPPPDPEYLQYFGRGLTREQTLAVQETKAAFLVEWVYPRDRVWECLRQANATMHTLAGRTGGLLWDQATRELFTADAWQERRLDKWTDEIPGVPTQTVIHAYQDGEYVRAITLGMEKFGLPDLVVEGFPWSLNNNVGHVINLFGQAILEDPVLPRAGEFDLDIRKIRNADVRDPQLSTLKGNATGIARLGLQKGTPDDGDPENRLIEITFHRGKGPDIHARQSQVLMEAFGWEESIAHIQHDDAILAASAEARKKLPELQAAFNQGLEPGESILVKAPFETPDGSDEWMWVEVVSWKGNRITGSLQNEPRNIPNLHAGQQVDVSQQDVFDYLRRRPDGKVDGNETGKLIERGR